ncbi:hypothetical protein OROHE_016409 [Orobanche hederae]
MARFVSLCIVILVVLLAYHSATSKGDNLDLGESRGCREQIDRQRLSSCREYLRDSSRFESMTMMPENERSGWREEFPRCCEELEQINEKCRCQAIKQSGAATTGRGWVARKGKARDVEDRTKFD